MRRASRLMIAGLISTILVFCSVVPVHPMGIFARVGQPAIFQQFEHGFMIATGGSVEVFPYNEKDHLAFAFPQKDITTLKEYPLANRPPERDYQPNGDFGKLWSNSLRIMQELGWAITPPIRYTAQVGAASGWYIGLPMSDFCVKTNPVSIMAGRSDSVDFSLLNGTILHGSQMIWMLGPWPDQKTSIQNCGTQRIQFQAGNYSAMVPGMLGAGCSEMVFLLKAQARQRMTISLLYEGRPVIGSVTAPDGTNIQMPRNEVLFDGILPATGDYGIRVRPDSAEPEPILRDEHSSQQYQYRFYTLLIVIR